MDFKSLINKIESIDGKIESVAAPELPKAVQLNEDAELRVLAGTSSYLSEAKKAKEEKKDKEVEEGFDADSKTGDTFKTKTGVATKTKTGVKHEKTYEKEKDEEDDDASKSKKAKKESIDPTAFKSKFDKMVEAKKAKPDFLDVDKDGDKKEPMKKAVADKKKGAVKEAEEKGDEYGWDVKEKPKAKETSRKVAGKAYGGEKQKDDEDKKVDEATGDYSAKKGAAGKDLGKPGKNFAKIAKKAEKGGAKSGEAVAGAVLKKLRAKESVQSSKKVVAESVEQKLSFKQMVQLVQESGGQQQIDPKDKELFNWASRVAASKLGEGTKAELYAGLIYERNGGVFELYDVLSESKKLSEGYVNTPSAHEVQLLLVGMGFKSDEVRGLLRFALDSGIPSDAGPNLQKMLKALSSKGVDLFDVKDTGAPEDSEEDEIEPGMAGSDGGWDWDDRTER